MAFVAMALNAQVEYSTLTFPDENSENNACGAYNKEWEAKIGDNSWNLSAFNNNSWNNWTYVRCGRKSDASVATILTNNAYEAAINKVVVTLTKANAEKLNSLTLQVLDGENIVATVEPAGEVAVGDVEFNIANPVANAKYLITFDMPAAGSNGIFEITKIAYYAAADGPTVTSDIKNVYFWNYAYADPEAGTWYETNRQYITVTENNFDENVVLSSVMKSSGKAKGSYLENNTRFEVAGTVFTSGQINVASTSKKPGVYEDVIQLKSGDEIYLEIPVKMVIVGTSDDGTIYDDEVYPFNVADAYAIHSIMPTGGNYYTDPTHEWSAYDDGIRYYKGIVSSIDEISTQYGNATFNIKDEDGEKTLKVFRVKGLENEKITDENLIKEGDEVVICAELCDYNAAPELKNGYIHSITPGTATAISNVAYETANSNMMYNLAGQRVTNAKGIVIVNGKKVMAK